MTGVFRVVDRPRQPCSEASARGSGAPAPCDNTGVESSTNGPDRSGLGLTPAAVGETGFGPAPAPAGSDFQQPSSLIREPKPWWRRAGGAAIAIGLLIFKFGAKLKGLLLLLPKLKFFTTSASMLVSVAAYTLIWTWKFALGFVLLLLIHEIGHVLQLRREGIKATAPLFIPFLGAAVGMKELPKDGAAEARVGLAGPILGSLGCLIPVALFALTGDELFKALAFIGFFLNLINLAPVLPLDGGRAMAVMSPWVWVIGFGVFVGVAIAFPNPVMILILLLGAFETYRRFKARNTPESRAFRNVPTRTRIAVAAVYIGLIVALAIGVDLTFVERSLSDV